jgi:hypothetical protein
MERDQLGSGDYGYDLVHEETRAAPARPDAAGHQDAEPRSSGSPVARGDEAAGDLSYDEAHGF